MTVSTVLALHALTTFSTRLLQGRRRYDSREGIGTTPWMGEVELCLEQRSRVESGTETENCTWSNDRESSLEQRPRKCREHIFQKKSMHDASIDQTPLIY